MFKPFLKSGTKHRQEEYNFNEYKMPAECCSEFIGKWTIPTPRAVWWFWLCWRSVWDQQVFWMCWSGWGQEPGRVHRWEGEFDCCWQRYDDLMYFGAMKMGGVGQINQLLWFTEMSGETRASRWGEVGCVAWPWGSVEGEAKERRAKSTQRSEPFHLAAGCYGLKETSFQGCFQAWSMFAYQVPQFEVLPGFGGQPMVVSLRASSSWNPCYILQPEGQGEKECLGSTSHFQLLIRNN